MVGTGHAEKRQIRIMVEILLGRCQIKSADAADALAVAICHAHYRTVQYSAFDPGEPKNKAPS